MATKTQHHTIGSLDIYEHADKLFTKHILKAGTGDVTANVGSVCTVYVRIVDYPLEISEEDLGHYKLEADAEVTIGYGANLMAELIDQVVMTMKEGESAYVKSSKNHEGVKIPELDMKTKGLKFNVVLKNLNRAADLEELEADEKFELAHQHKTAGSELYKKNNIAYATKQYNKALKCLIAMEPSENIPEVLKSDSEKLKCQCYLNLGACCLIQEDWDEVVSVCDKALELEPQNVKGLYRRGQAYSHLDKWTEARVDLQQALKQEPGNKAVANQLKSVESKLKQEKDMYKKMFVS